MRGGESRFHCSTFAPAILRAPAQRQKYLLQALRRVLARYQPVERPGASPRHLSHRRRIAETGHEMRSRRVRGLSASAVDQRTSTSRHQHRGGFSFLAFFSTLKRSSSSGRISAKVLKSTFMASRSIHPSLRGGMTLPMPSTTGSEDCTFDVAVAGESCLQTKTRANKHYTIRPVIYIERRRFVWSINEKTMLRQQGLAPGALPLAAPAA